MVWATRFELAFTPWDVPPVTQQDYFNRNEYLKIQSVVWATRFELAFTPWDVPPVTQKDYFY